VESWSRGVVESWVRQQSSVPQSDVSVRENGCVNAAAANDQRLRTNDLRLRTSQSLRLIPLVVRAQVQPGAGEMDRVLADLVAEQAAGLAVLVAGDVETACKIAQPRDDDE
jgi:hypothetical protein